MFSIPRASRFCRLIGPALVGATCLGVLVACGGGESATGAPSVGAAATATAKAVDPPIPIPAPVSALRLTLPRQGIVAAELGVIVAEGDALSEAIAADYQAARGIPAANVIRVKLRTGVDAISAADFALLKAEIDAKLPVGVQATLLTWTAPWKVTGSCAMSITSAVALGFDAKYCGNGCVATAASPLYDSESSAPWTDHKIRPSMMLGARTRAAAKTLIERGISADASHPAGDGYFLRTSDSARSGRYTDQQPLPARWASRLQLNYLDNAGGGGVNALVGKTKVLFYFTGLAKVPDIASNSFQPGAVADHLTSFGGVLASVNGQMPITDWIDGGATASHGTVEEPCNFAQKFSRASVLIDHYWRGDTLIEAYWKSVEWPGQGLFVGEPLAQPFRDVPSVNIDAGQYVINTRALRPGGGYTLDYRSGSAGAWTSLASFTNATAQAQILRAPLPPAEATQLRWVGPCPTNTTQQCTLAESTG